MTKGTAYRYVTSDGHNAVVFWDHVAWVAMCLEHDISVQGRDAEQIKQRMEWSLAAHKRIAEDRGEPALHRIAPSPSKYHEMWENSDANL